MVQVHSPRQRKRRSFSWRVVVSVFLGVFLVGYLGFLKAFSSANSKEQLSSLQEALKDSKLSNALRKPTMKRLKKPLVDMKSSSNMPPYIVSFVGDTMIAPYFAARDRDDWTIEEPLVHVGPLLKKSDYSIINLEGPITKLGIKHDPLNRGPAYSFNMDPSVAKALKDIGVTGAGLANNHFNDRGLQGLMDTQEYLEEAGIEYFGVGETPESAAEPLLIKTPMGVTLGVTGFCDLDDYKSARGPGGEGVPGSIHPKTSTAKIAMKVLEERGVDVKIAFVHWGRNYEDPEAKRLRKRAKALANAGFDLIIGSDGSHIAQPFDMVNGVPVLYSTGNFCFLTPGRFNMKFDTGSRPLPYGMVVDANFDRDSGKLTSLSLHCTAVDNKKINYQPRVCTPKEATKLFKNMGRYVRHEKGAVSATIPLGEIIDIKTE